VQFIVGVEPCNALDGIGILDEMLSVPNQPASIQVLAQDAVAARSLAALYLRNSVHYESIVDVRRSPSFQTNWQPHGSQNPIGINRRMICSTSGGPRRRTSVGATSSASAWLVRSGPIASNFAFCSSVSIP
jgi:hypothetical protein